MREMKDSGIEWIGTVPEDWEVSKIDVLYNLRNTKVSDRDYQALSVTKQGILPQLENVAKTNDGDSRKLVMVNDFVINSRSDRRGSCGISVYEGSVSLINTVLMPNEEIKMNNQYYDWLFHTTNFSDEFYKWGHGIVDDLWTTGWQEMRKIVVTYPPLSEQNKIAAFLDKKCGQIDKLSEKLQGEIQKLQEYKKSLISETVTQGLDKNVAMKDSGVDWIGKIPEHWKISKNKYFLTMNSGDNIDTNFINNIGLYPVYGGNGLRGYLNRYNYEGEFLLIGRQGALSGNVHKVCNKFWATEHALVGTLIKKINFNYLYYVLGQL